MNEWHRKRRDSETDMEEWMGIGFESMKCSQWPLWHICLPLEMVRSHPPWQARLCIRKLNLRRDKEDYQVMLPVLTLLSDSLILNSSSTTFLCDFSQFTQPLQICIQSVSQFSRSVVSNSVQLHELQHARPLCPTPTPGVYSNSCPLSR